MIKSGLGKSASNSRMHIKKLNSRNYEFKGNIMYTPFQGLDKQVPSRYKDALGQLGMYEIVKFRTTPYESNNFNNFNAIFALF